MANNAIKQITIRRGNDHGGIDVNTYDIGGGGGGVSAYGTTQGNSSGSGLVAALTLSSEFDDFTFENNKLIFMKILGGASFVNGGQNLTVQINSSSGNIIESAHPVYKKDNTALPSDSLGPNMTIVLICRSNFNTRYYEQVADNYTTIVTSNGTLQLI